MKSLIMTSTYLGNAHVDGPKVVAMAARRAVIAHGRVALFIGANGEADAYSYWHVDYDRQCHRRIACLVGVYEADGEAYMPVGESVALLEDIRCHLRSLPRMASLRREVHVCLGPRDMSRPCVLRVAADNS